jgi:hypothetical protein
MMDGLDSMPGTMGDPRDSSGERASDINTNYDDTGGSGNTDGFNFFPMPEDYSGYTTGQMSDPSSRAYDPGMTGQGEGSSMWDSLWNRFKQFGMGQGVQQLRQRAGVAAPLVGPAVAGLSAPEGQRTQAFGNAVSGNVLNSMLYGINPVLGGLNSLLGMATGHSLGGMFQSTVNPDGRVAPMNSGGSSDSNKGQQNYGTLDNVLTGLAGLYSANQNNRAIKNQMGSLTGMYGQDSPYATTLRETLARRDAAGGRRNSGAGTREVELQAKLAEMASRNSGAVANLAGQRNSNRMQNLNSLMYLGRSSGLFDKIGKGISGLFDPEPDYNRLLDQQG